jgi:hypothetical protein
MAELVLTLFEALCLTLESLAGDIASWFQKGPKRKRAKEKWVTR